MAQQTPVRKRIVPVRVAAHEVAAGNLASCNLTPAVGAPVSTTDAPLAPGRRMPVDISTAYLVTYPEVCVPIRSRFVVNSGIQVTLCNFPWAARKRPAHVHSKMSLQHGCLQLLKAHGVDARALKSKESAKEKEPEKDGKPAVLPRMPGAPWQVRPTAHSPQQAMRPWCLWLFAGFRRFNWVENEIRSLAWDQSLCCRQRSPQRDMCV